MTCCNVGDDSPLKERIQRGNGCMIIYQMGEGEKQKLEKNTRNCGQTDIKKEINRKIQSQVRGQFSEVKSSAIPHL